ncbi:MAG: O-antigen ligase family protein [Nitrospirae bacterium]|nr:O-antigen ligase family protein [Nitrospirota bacterium]
MNITQAVRTDPNGQNTFLGPPGIALFFLYLLAVSLPVSIASTHIALGGLFLFGIYQYGVKWGHLIRTSFDGPVLIYLSAVLTSALFGVNPGRSLISMAQFWHIALYLIVVNTVSTPSLARRLIFLMVGVGALNGLYGILQHVTGGLDLFAFGRPARILVVDDIVRASGVFDHFMTFSGQMLMLGALVSGLILFWADGAVRWALSAAFILFFGGVVSSLTRNAWLGLLAGVLVVGGFKDRATLVRTVLLVTATVSVLMILSPGLRNRGASMGNVKSDGSNIERLNIWRTTIDMIRDRPLLGVGKGNYTTVMDQYRGRYGARAHSHAHNTLLQVTAENGLVGLLGYLYLWFVFFREMIRSLKPETGSLTRGVAVGVIGALVGFHVAGLFEYNLGDSEVDAMMWFIVGLGLAARAGHFEKNPDPLRATGHSSLARGV